MAQFERVHHHRALQCHLLRKQMANGGCISITVLLLNDRTQNNASIRAKALPQAAEDAIADFIFKEIYMNFGAPEEIFTDGGKNLWGGVIYKYLERIKMVHKGISPCHYQRTEKWSH